MEIMILLIQMNQLQLPLAL